MALSGTINSIAQSTKNRAVKNGDVIITISTKKHQAAGVVDILKMISIDDYCARFYITPARVEVEAIITKAAAFFIMDTLDCDIYCKVKNINREKMAVLREKSIFKK